MCILYTSLKMNAIYHQLKRGKAVPPRFLLLVYHIEKSKKFLFILSASIGLKILVLKTPPKPQPHPLKVKTQLTAFITPWNSFWQKDWHKYWLSRLAISFHLYCTLKMQLFSHFPKVWFDTLIFIFENLWLFAFEIDELMKICWVYVHVHEQNI